MRSASGRLVGVDGRAPGSATRRLGLPAPRILLAAGVVFLGACFLDQLTSSGVDVTDFTLTVTGDSLVQLGGTEQLALLVQGPVDSVQGPTRRVWATSDAGIATVDSTGLVTGTGIGTVTVTVRLTAPELDTALAQTRDLRVRYASIVIDPVDSLEGFGRTVMLVARGRDIAGAAVAQVAAAFSAPSATVAAVTAAGLVTARGNGTVTVTASFDAMTDQEDVRVRQVAKSVQFSINNLVFPALNRDTSATLVVRDVGDSLITAPSVTWSTSNAAVVSVTSAGVMRALQVAAATITARVDTASGTLPTNVTQVPTAMVVSAGGGQTDTVGLPIAVPPCVTVQDAGSSPVANITVTFTVTLGGGSVTGATPITNAAGVACVGSWTLGSAAGTNRLQADAGTLTPVTITATGVPGGANQIARIAGDSQTATVGTAVPVAPRVRLQDAFGNPVAGATVVFTVATGGGAVTGANQTTDASGNATVGSWTLGNLNGTNTLTAASGSLTTTFTATGTAAGPALLSLSSGGSQTASVGTAVSIPPSVRVTDGFGNPVQNVAVTFAVNSGNGTIVGGAQTTNVNGLATVGSWTLDTLAGGDTLTASASGLTSVVFTATGTAGTAAVLDAVAGDLQTDTVGSSVTIAPSVMVTDVYSNPKAGVTVTFTVLTGVGSVSGATRITNASGVATVTSWTLGTTAGTNNNTLRASTAALADTFTASALPGAAANVAEVSGNGQVGAPGGTLASPYIIKVTDAFGNGVSLVTINWSAGSGGSITTPAVTNASGFAQALHTLGATPGTQVATATPATPLAGSPVIFTATANSTPTQVALFAGNNQSATVGTAVSTPPSVQVTDQAGNPSANVTVTFAVGIGVGSVTAATQSTNAAGVATVGSWTLGAAAGTDNNTLTATAPGLQGSPVTFTASATAGPAATIALNAGNNQTTTAGSTVPIPPSVRVTDQFGNSVAATAVTFTVTAGGGTVGGSSQAAVNSDPAGIATVANWVLGTVAGANLDTVLATSGSLSGSPVTFVASTTPRPAAAIAPNSAANQTDTVGLPVATPPSVLVTDQFGNPVANQPVTFAVVNGGGNLTGASQTTNASGVATVGSWTLGLAAGTNNNSMVATSGSLSGSPVIFTASATNGAATQIASNGGNSQTATVNTAVGTAPSVLVSDQFGNPVAGVTVSFAPATGSGSVTGGTPSSNASGVAAVGSWTLGTTAGANRDTLRASATGLTGSPVVFTATGTAGAAAQIAKAAGDNQSAFAGSPVPVLPQVLATDQFGNPVAGVKIGFAVTGGGGSITGDTAFSNASGLAAVGSWTLGGTPGPNTLSATSVPALSGSPLTFTATGGSAGPTTMALDGGNGQTGTVNTALGTAYSVVVTDATSLPVAGVTVSWAVTSGGGSIAATSVTNASGIATATRTLGQTAGSQTATASVGGLTGSPVTFTATATPDAPTQLLAGDGGFQTATVNTTLPISPSVRVFDQFNNGVAGVPVTFALSGLPQGSITGANPITNASGVATVGSWTLATQAGPQQMNASSGTLTGSPVPIIATGTAGPAAALALNAGNGQSATVNTAVATPPSARVTDAFGNPIGGFGVTFAVTSGGGSITGATPQTNASGVATVGSWTLGTAAGANTLTASTSPALSGSPVTFTATGSGGPPSTTTSLVLVGAGTVPSATSTTLTLNSKDAFGNPAQSGHAVGFTQTGGTSTGTIGPATDQGNGTYTATFTGVIAGTARTIGATINGSAVTTALPTITVTPGAPSQIAVSAGNNQSTQVNTSVSVNPAARVSDVNGNAVSGVLVTFAVATGGGVVQGATPTSSASGLAQVTRWTLGTVAGGNTLTATAAGLAGSPLTFTATGTPGPVSLNTSVTTVSSDSVAAGSAVTITLQAKDAFGNNQTSGGLSGVTFTLSGGTSDGSLGATTDNGNGTYSASYTGTIAGTPDTVRATVGVSPVTTPPPLLRVVPGPAAFLLLHQGDGQSAMIGTAVATAPSVFVQDAFGNLVPQALVHFQAFSGASVRDTLGNLVPDAFVRSSGAGIATVPAWILSTLQGSQLLQATIPNRNVNFDANATVPTTMGSIRLGNLLLGENPVAVAVSSNLNRAYVATQGGLSTGPGITVIDGQGGDTALASYKTSGGTPIDVAVSEAHNNLYVISQGSTVVEAYDLFSNSQTAIGFATCPTLALAASPQQARVYAVNVCGELNQLNAFNLVFENLFGIGGNLTDVAANTRLGTVYVADATGQVYVFCGGQGSGCGFNSIQFVTAIGIGGQPKSLAVDTISANVFVTDRLGRLHRINGFGNFVDASVPLPFAGDGTVEVNPSSGTVYVTDSTTGQVAVYDEFSLGLKAVLPLGRGTLGVGANQFTGRSYIANVGSGTVSVVAGPTFQSTVARAGGPRGVAVNPNTGRVYVANDSSQNVAVTDGSFGGGSLIDAIPIGGSAWDVAVNPSLNRVYAVNRTLNSLTVLDGDSHANVANIPVGSLPTAVATNPVTGRVYVTSQLTGTLSIIDGNSNMVLFTVAVGGSPVDVAVDTAADLVYIALDGGSLAELFGPTSGSETSVLGPFGLPGPGSAVGANPGNGQAYFISQAAGFSRYTVWDGLALSGVATNDLSGEAFALGMNTPRHAVFVPTNGGVNVLSTDLTSIVTTLPLSVISFGAGVDNSTHRIYLSGYATGRLYFLQN